MQPPPQKSTKKFLKAFSAEAPDAVRDAMLNRTSSVGARAVSLLMQVLQCEAGLHLCAFVGAPSMPGA
jgi:hypothetical protein